MERGTTGHRNCMKQKREKVGGGDMTSGGEERRECGKMVRSGQ